MQVTFSVRLQSIILSIKGILNNELENEEEESEKDDLRELMSTNAIAILSILQKVVVSWYQAPSS